MNDRTKKGPPRNPISRREWVARAIDAAREAVADPPLVEPASRKKRRPPADPA
ncbi:MAG: hypothetical protein ACREVN_04140 [Gammaproteobacteria bacterium]